MGYLEYIAVLVSPSPKDTLKAVEARRQAVEARMKAEENSDNPAGPVVIDASSGIFKNTSFYDSLAAEAGVDPRELQAMFGEQDDSGKQPVTYIKKQGQTDYFQRAIEAHQKGEELEPLPSLQTQLQKMHMDAIEF